MPCSSEGMGPCDWECEGQEAAQFAVYVLKKLERPIDVRLQKIAKNMYPSKVQADFAVSTLCTLMRGLSKRDLDKVAYDAKSKTSRALADWWEEHQEQDRLRIEREARERDTKAARAAAIKKLTPRERELLGLS